MPQKHAIALSDRGYRLLWIAMGVVTAMMLSATIVVTFQRDRANVRRWLLFLSANPRQGQQVFADKGCTNCHVINGAGASSGPDLGAGTPESATLPQLVVAMWNHAPRMWDSMRAKDLSYPKLSYEETAQLLAFLYRSRLVDEPGDAGKGRAVFVDKGCIYCHSIRGHGGRPGPDLSTVAQPHKLGWVQAMWNHGSAMRASMAKLGIAWPQFQPGELNDLLMYLQQSAQPGERREPSQLGDPDGGWDVYRNKSCLVCHSVKEESGRLGPNLGPTHKLPATVAGLAALMWNEFPEMQRAINHRKIPLPEFQGSELADLIAFLHSLRYLEPNGSPHLGQTVFGSRGCARCHGDDAEGTDLGPALRGKGRIYNSIALATALWKHGGAPYRRLQEAGINWPTLQEGDIGDLLSFLHQPVKRSRAN